jgi:two-component system alkaline phosphatase synthesis response regulator PhoP
MKHSFHLNGKAIDLTNKEFELMKRLLSNPEIVIPRSSLIDEIWGHDFSGESRTLDVHIATLRQKLGEAGDCIETVRGIGYRMRSKQRRRNHEKANPNF